MKLRPYQQKLVDEINSYWSKGVKNVCAVLPTGGGKSLIVTDIVKANVKGGSCVIAHRQELVGQMSVHLARAGIMHNILASESVVRNIIKLHMLKVGKNFYDPQSKNCVAGVDTLNSRKDKPEVQRMCQLVTRWIIDECHHIAGGESKPNKWYRATKMFTNALGLGVTATPQRADGQGLGNCADGVFDVMVEGPNPRWLINQGFLTEYKIYAPPSKIDLSNVRVSQTTGDYNPNDLTTATMNSHLVQPDDKKSRVVGDIVSHYIKFANGKLGVTFCTDLKIAAEIASQYNKMNIKAEVISGKNSDTDRASILSRFEKREIMQLVTVDIISEGFDIPAIEVVSFARPTQSYGLYAQQFGRALRILEGKEYAIIIDHVDNVMRHGLPDAPRQWSLDRRVKRSSGPSDAEPLRVCTSVECLQPFPRVKKECPWCGHPVPPPSDRSGPESVDGDLFELDADTLAAMRGSVVNLDDPDEAIISYRRKLQHSHTPKQYELAHVKRFAEKLNTTIESQRGLRDMMAWYGGHWRAKGSDDGEIYRRFYLTFGIDWLSAMALESAGADKLAEQVAIKIGEML